MNEQSTTREMISDTMPVTIDETRALLVATGEEPPSVSRFDIIPLNTAIYRLTAGPTGNAVVIPSGESITIHDDTARDAIIVVGCRATLRYITTARAENTTRTSARRTIYAMRDAQIDWIDAMTGSPGQPTAGFEAQNTVLLAGTDARAKFRSVFLGAGDEEYHSVVRMLHLVSRTKSHMLTRAALLGKSSGRYRGLIRIMPGAQKCDAYQRSDTLLVGDRPRMDALPVLEIHNDDVRCSHGVAIGRVDQEPLFYLRSRGIPAGSAMSMLVRGFFDPVLISMGEDGRLIGQIFSSRLSHAALSGDVPCDAKPSNAEINEISTTHDLAVDSVTPRHDG